MITLYKNYKKKESSKLHHLQFLKKYMPFIKERSKKVDIINLKKNKRLFTNLAKNYPKLNKPARRNNV